MNSVSWFLYLIEVVGNLRAIATAVLFSGILAVGGSALFAPIILMMAEDFGDGATDWLKTAAKVFATAWVVSLPVYLFTPSKNTMYAMAASEVGEQIIKTELASDATKALHQWIKKQIEPEAKK